MILYDIHGIISTMTKAEFFRDVEGTLGPELSGVYSWLCGWRQCNTSAIVLLGAFEDENLAAIWLVLVSLS